MIKMITKLFHKIIAFIRSIGRSKEDISWKEISGMVKHDKRSK